MTLHACPDPCSFKVYNALNHSMDGLDYTILLYLFSIKLFIRYMYSMIYLFQKQ